ncbi:MAG: Ig-like domain-containing protein [Acidobacteriota bacterium]
MLRTVRTIAVLASLCAFGSPRAVAQPGSPLGTAQLQISGARLTIYSDTLTTDADQTVNVGEAARVRTCYGASGVCGTAAPASVPGLKVVGDLSGPELPQAIPYETAPGGTFFLPGFQREGDYLLANIRLVDTATGRVLANAEPSLATLHVRQILLASATVTRLTLADLQARGIAITQQNFQAFSFSVGFIFSGQAVNIELPVIFQAGGTILPLDKQTVVLDGLPDAVKHAVSRWEPPRIVPFQLAGVPGTPGGELDPEPIPQDTPLYGAIVIPGNVSFLNQFFDARLIVANGAPAGSSATLQNVTGALRLPTGEYLRLASTTPPVAAGQKIPVTKANGSGVVGAGEQGAASWTVEGLVAGTQTLRMDIAADLVRPGRVTLPLAGSVQAAVEVVDARFNLSFNHPDVVREGEPYSLYVTVTNLSRAAQNLITVELLSENITGAHKADPADPFRQTIPTLDPGASETLEFRLVSDTTGKCVATTFQSSSTGVTGAIHLRTGVGELGIPLSPASLVLPRFSELLPRALITADVRLLGLAYSLAVAPAGAAPAGLPHVVKSDVVRRAVDLGEAGQRIFLQERLLESLEALALDQLGNRHDLEDYDTLRRSLDKGAAAATALSDLFRQEQQNRNFAAADFVDHFAATTDYGRPYLAAALVPNGSQPAPVLEVRQVGAAGTTFLAYTSDDTRRLRSIPYGETYAIADLPGGTTRMPFALVGRLDPATSYRVDLHAPATPASGRLILLVPTDDLTGFRKVDFGFVSMGAGEVWEVRAAKAAGDGPLTFVLYFPSSLSPVPGVSPGTVTALQLPPFRLIGAVEDFTLDRYGLGVSYLFNRPPERAPAETAANYAIRSTFHGQDTASPAVTFDKVATKAGRAAFWQPNSERVVNVSYRSPISALEGTFESQPVIRHEHLLQTNQIRDTHGTPLDPSVPAALIEPNHVGGLVDGRVLLGTGEPAAGATVQLIRYHNAQPLLGGEPLILPDLVAEVTTGSDGAFYFDFIEEPPQNKVLSGFTLRATVPPGSDPAQQPGGAEEVSSTIRLQNRLVHVNIALLGRGTVKGRLVFADTGTPVPNGRVVAASTLFSEAKDVVVAADGSFTINALPVGPITLTGSDAEGHRVYQTVGLQQPGQTVTVLLQLARNAPPKTGTVVGRVLRQRSGSPPPPPDASPGAQVAVYANGSLIQQKLSDASGNFRFDKVPEGQIQVQAADFSVSRTPAIGGAVLAADATVTLTLTISDAVPRVVTGRVLYHDGALNVDVPVTGAVAFITGPGVFAYTDTSGSYRIEGVPVQGLADAPYVVTAIDFTRQLQGVANLPPILDVGDGSPIRASDIVLRAMTGGIDGVVLDPLGHPAARVTVTIPHGPEASTGSDGRFSINDVGVGGVTLVAHAGDGLAPGRIGYLGTGNATIVFAGHRPFTTIRLRGAGVVNVHTRTGSSTGVLSPIRYTPTVYRANTYDIGPSPLPVDTTTDPDGRLQLVLPLPGTIVTAFSPTNGNKSAAATLTYPGQVVNLEIVFDSASALTGHVVGVDGVTPVPNVDVFLAATGLLPQRQRTDGQGGFRYDLVPPGPVSVTTEALVGSVDRVGRADGRLVAGQTIDLTVVLRAQGTVKGRVVQLVGSSLVPIPFARYSITESAYPNRRLPAGTATFAADANGAYEVAHLFAGPVTVVAADPGQVTRQGRVTGEITSDFQVLSLPDIVLTTSVGSLGVLVRDAASGSPVSDCQVTLSNGDVTVSDGEGKATFDALPLGTYSVYAFHAPTGQGGLVSGLRIANAGDRAEATITLDTRGRIAGTLWDDVAKTRGAGNGTVKLTGRVNGRLWGTTMTALASTSPDAATLGQFLFDGIPVGNFTLEAAVSDSARRASTALDLTPTAPVISVDLVLEQLADRYVRIFQNLKAAPHLFEIDPSTGIFSVELTQPPGNCSPNCTYDFVLNTPSVPYPNHLYRFQDVFASRSLGVVVLELSGEQRKGSISGLASLPGAGTASDPFRVVLGAKGTVNVLVRDAVGSPVAGANVTLTTTGSFGSFGSTTDGTGRVTYDAIAGGSVTATAKRASNGTGGLAAGVLTYDDESLDLTVSLAPAVSAHGVVYHPPPGDIYNGDPLTLVPEDRAIVQIRDSANQLQILVTGSDGVYRFNALKTGSYTISASNETSESFAAGAGTLAGPDGNDNALPNLILDASRPLIVSVTPPPGQTGVSRNAVVEIVFSEPLLPAVVPNGVPTSPYFALRSGATGLVAAGSWTSALDGAGRQVVRFTPSSLYDNSTIYSLSIAGGPSGVRDRAGRSLTDSGDVGTNFTTSDTVGASVVGTVPLLGVPVDPASAIRFDFSEVVSGTAAELDGDGVGDAAELFWQPNGSSVWQPIPITMFLTRGGYSLTIQPPAGVTYTNDSLKRRVHVSRLRDVSVNPMVDYDRTFRIWDTNAPHVDAAFPPGAPAGNLSGGTAYVVTPGLSNLDDLANGPGGDIDRVDYFLASASDPTVPAATPVFSGRVYPFAFSFVAAYVGNGIDPRPFPVWVQAVDTSANKSNVVKLSMQVLPNAPPVITSVAAAATAPVAGTFYAGSSLAATVSGVADPDGSAITLTAELRKNNAGSPNDPADLVASLPSQALTRPAGGWAVLPPPVFAAAIPIATTDGTSLFFRVKATDSLGSSTTSESARFAVVHDPNPPTIDSFVARLSGASSPASQFFIGQKLVLEFRARDAETAVRAASLTLSGVFTSPQAVTLVGGTTNLYRTAELTVPATVPVGGLSVTATASGTDWGGNTGTLPLVFNVSPTPDPYAPVVTWLTPWEGGAWPSGYTSTVSAQGAALLLRVRATDLDRISGSDVSGTIASVQFKGPADAAGTLAPAFVDGSLVAGTGGPGTGTYEALWRVPNGVAAGTQLPFQVRVVDAGANATTVDVHLRAAPPRKVFEAAQVAALPADTLLGAGGDVAGPVFLLDGAVLSVYPQASPAVRSLPSMYVYAGGVAAGASFTPTASVLTAPEITSYASSVLYNPLELTVTDTLGVGHGARIDVSAKGLLGSTPTQSMVLPGQTGSQQYAGGSHGGSGGPGSSNFYWAPADLTVPGSVYDFVKDPFLPGGGGGYATGLYGATAAGGTGGGVVRLLGPAATMHLEGEILADGGNGPGGVLTGGGGAGGAIRIVARRLEGAGRVSSAGGRGSNRALSGGGGGGRIALSFADPTAASLPLTVNAAGGSNDLSPDAYGQQVAGAGTIYLEELDALGAPKAPGRLIVTNASGKPAWPTPFSGPQRFGAVEGHGAARLVFADDLTVGPADPGVVNDRASVSFDAEARMLLKTDQPQVSLTANPTGGNVNVNQTLSLTWTASDPIGLDSVTTFFSPLAPVTTAYDAEPLSVTQGAGPLTLTVPGAQPPGPISYTLTATDRAGRVATVQKTWIVLTDTTLPVVSVSGLVAGGVYRAGQAVSGTVTATDNGSIASVKVLVDGQTLTLSGAGPTYPFSYLVPRDLAAARDTTLQAVATDAAGNPASTNPVTLHFLLDAPPSLTLTGVTPGPSVLPGATLTATATASDDVAVSTVVFTLSGAASTVVTRTVNALSTTQSFTYQLPVTLTAGQTVTLQVDAFDSYGHKVSAAPVTYTILPSIPPSKLAFGTQPSDTTVGASITPAVTVRLLDNADNQTVSTASVTIAIGTNPGGGTLSGTLTVAAVAGVATFANLSIDRLGTGYTLTATSAGLMGATSVTFNITTGVATKILVETAADGGGTVVPAQSIPAGSSLTVYAVSRDVSNNFLANVVPDSWSLTGITGGAAGGDLVANAAGMVTEFPLSFGGAPSRIAAGPDGNLWFTEYDTNKIGRISRSGVITEFSILTPSGQPDSIAAGPDGNLWFTEYQGDKIGRITTAGVVTEFPTPTAISRPSGIAAGPDGNLWFTEYQANKIGRITVAGVVTEFAIPTAVSNPTGIVAGPDGNLWFAEESAGKIGRITIAGVVTEFSIPAGSGPYDIAAGPDGNLWFTEFNANKIGRITPAGVVTEFPIPAASSAPFGIAAGPDGNLWFTEFSPNKIGRITSAGVVTEFPVPTAVSGPFGIVAGRDGSLWFTERSANKIGRIATGVSATFTGHLAGSASIHAAKAGLTSTDSGTVTVLTGAAAKLAFGTAPSNTIAGSPITPAVTVRIVDAGGNLMASAASVTVAIGTNAGGGTLSGTLTVAAVGGVATFSGLSIDKAGTGYTLTAASSGLTGATSSSFDVLPRPASQLAFGTPPSNTPMGSAITPAVKVRILDDGGNLTASTALVTVAIGTNPAGGTLSGTLTVAAVAGVATFNDLSIEKFGTGYTMTAAGAGLTGATSGTFSITARSATKILVETAADGSGTVVPAQNIPAGTSLTVYSVSRDASDNFVANVTPDSWSLTGIAGGVVAGDLVPNAAGTFSEFPIPTVNSQPQGIAAGPDGNIWFTESSGNKVVRITPGALITEFPIPTANSQPLGIAAGPDGNMWFAEYNANKIGRITTAGVITEFPIPTTGSRPIAIAAGPDGNLWFAEYSANKIGRITTAGVITEFLIPSSGSQPYGITAGPDGNIWFTESNGNKIGRITTAGAITEFPILTASSYSYGIAAGPDGNIWFTEFAVNKIGRITPAGVVSEFPIPTSFSQPYGIAAGPDGNIWFVENAGNKIGRVTTAGIFTEFTLPTSLSTPVGIAAGPDGNFWFTETGTNKIGRIATGGSATFTGHLPGSAAIHAARAGLTATDSGTLAVPQGAPSKLVIGTQPSTTSVGSVITPPVTVKILDASGYQPTTSTAPVTLSIGTNPGGGTISGTLTVAAVAGVATFSDLSIDRFGTGYSLTATSAGLSGATSGTFNVTAGPTTKILVETAANGGGTVVPAQGITAGNSLTVYAIARDANNNFVGNVQPDSWSLAGTTGGVVTGDLTNSLGAIAEFPIPTASSAPYGIAAGADGNLWFTGYNSNRIGRVTPAGVFTEFSIPTSLSRSHGIAAGPDGNLWFTEESGNKIGRITTAGATTEFPIPTAGSSPYGIAAGPDGNIWFTEQSANKIGRITTAGAITEFPIPTASSRPYGIAAGPDGNLWFTENGGNKIGRITTAGAITEFPIPTASSSPNGIAAGPDGNVWFTEQSGNKIGRITTAGAITEFPIPTAGVSPYGIAAGPDGNFWFTEVSGNRIGRITTAGVVTEFTVTANSSPVAIAAGPDGNLWFAEYNGNKIGRITTGASATFTAHQPGSAAIHAGKAGLTSTDSGTLTVSAGPASKLVFGTQPSATQSGSAITPAVTVTILDAGGNQTASTAAVTVAIGTNAGGGTLSATLTVAAVAGVATFSDLSIDKVGTGYTLTGASAGLTGATSSPFNVTVGPPSKLAFGTQPSYTPVGSAISPAVAVKILDGGGNQTTSTAPVTLTIGTNPTGGTLSGTVTVGAVAGVATFSNLSIDRFGTGYTLTAASTGLTGATSITFKITAGPGTKILVETAADGSGTVVPAQNITAGGSLTVYAISRDASNNFVANMTPDSWALAGITGGVVAGDLVANSVGTLVESTIPTAFGSPVGIAVGPDGNLWFTEYNTSRIGRITPAGIITEFAIPTANSHPWGIAAGPDGNLWFAESGGNKIGRITTAGAFAEFPIPTLGGSPYGIAAGPDGNVWFAEYGGNKVGRITLAGVITEFSIPTAGSTPIGVSPGPDGSVWFTENSGNKIGRITPAGVVTEFAIPTAGSQPREITAGPDGNLWFIETSGKKIGRLTPAGAITEFLIPTAGSGPIGIAAGPDGNLWFTESTTGKIGRITTGGTITEFTIPTPSSQPTIIAAGPDGSLWFTESGANKIGRIATGGSATFTGHVAGSAAIHAAKAGLASTDSGTLTVAGAALRASLALSLCTDSALALKPGSSFVACADTEARDVSLEISGAFEGTIAGYGNCRDPISIPGSAKPGPLKIVATARDAEGKTASATTRAAVVADELAPVLVSVEPAPASAFRSGDPLRVAVETWDDVGIASVAITLGGTRAVLTAPPFEIHALAPPVASNESLPFLVEVFDPSGNVSRRAIELHVLPAGARLPLVATAMPESGTTFEAGRLSVDGGWPWRDADGEARGRTLELPAIGTHAALAVDGDVVALDASVARGAAKGGSVDVRRGDAFVGRFRILSVSEDGLVLRLEVGALGKVREGDFLEGVWSFSELMLARGARLVSGDVVEAGTIRVDASSVFLSKNLQIPSPNLSQAECPVRGVRPDPPGTAPASARGVAP